MAECIHIPLCYYSLLLNSTEDFARLCANSYFKALCSKGAWDFELENSANAALLPDYGSLNTPCTSNSPIALSMMSTRSKVKFSVR